MPHIIGTAGHIDHGKTALVRALTGQDTDRLKEEKERGISIDLGFACLDLSGGERAGIVDVPGHERFIRNMLAGAHGIDVVLLVVAADDGVMPQTEEHLDIVHLLGVSRAVVAITKADLADGARVDVVRDEIEILLAGTRLEGSPVVPVSSVTGKGIEELRRHIELQLCTVQRRPRSGYFRLPVDRVFVMHGHGTVVTGTAIAGRVRPGDSLRVLPGGEQARVRSVQVHGAEVAEATFGQRVALNLAAVEKTQLSRGHVVCDPYLDRVSDRLDAWFEVRPSARRQLQTHQAVRVYAGTAEAMGKIILLDGSPAWAPKQSGFCQLVLRAPIHALRGDRFIVRDESAQCTIGGGVVVHPFAQRHKRGEPRLLEALTALNELETRDSGPAPVLQAVIGLSQEFASDLSFLAQASGLRAEEVSDAIRSDPSLRGLPSSAQPQACTTEAKWRSMQARAVATLAAFHKQSSRSAGMEMESLRTQIAADLPAKLFRIVVEALVAAKAVVRDDSTIRLPAHEVSLQGDEEGLARRIEALLAGANFTPPDVKELEVQLGVSRPKLAAVLQQVEREGRIARVGDGMYFASEPLARARELIRAHCQAHGEITAAAFRDCLGASRKYSIALLDYFDRTGFTLRVGDARKLRRS